MKQSLHDVPINTKRTGAPGRWGSVAPNRLGSETAFLFAHAATNLLVLTIACHLGGWSAIRKLADLVNLRQIASLTMSAVSSSFEAHSSEHSEKSAISLSLMVCLLQPRLAVISQVRNSVRPMHLFGLLLGS